MQREVFSIIAIAILSALLALILQYTGVLVPVEQHLAALLHLPAEAVDAGKEPALPHMAAAQVFLVLLAGVLMAWWATSITNLTFLVLFLFIAAAEWIAFKAILAQGGIHYAASPALLTLLLSALAGAAWQRHPQEKERRRLLQVFAGRVAPPMLKGILRNPPLLNTPTPATILLIQLPDQTPADPSPQEPNQTNETPSPDAPTPEAQPPHASPALQTALQLIQDHHGLVAQESPNQLRAFFGGYQPDENHPLHAAQCVIALCRAFPPRDPQTLHGTEDMRIAVESGEVTPRFLDSPHGPELQLQGKVYGIVTRLHRACDLFPVRVLAGPKFQQMLASDGLFRPVELVRFGATQSPREVYQLIGLRDSASPQLQQRVEDFWKGVIFFREGQFDKAHEAFLEAQPLEDGDALIDYYLQRLKRAVADDAENRAGARTTRPSFII